MEVVKITTDYIKLEALMKFCAMAGTGGEAKMAIQKGLVFVNNEVCVQRGKKLRSGDTVEYGGTKMQIK